MPNVIYQYDESLSPRKNISQPYDLLLKLAQRIENLLVQAREDGFGLLDGLFLSSKYQYVMGTPCRFPATEKRNRNCLIGDFTNLLSQNELGILVIGVFASFEFGDLDVLLLEFLVVALFFFDQAVENRGGDCEL